MTPLTDEEFLAQCEEEFKDRFTEKDEEFMKVLNAEPSTPPILEDKRMFNNSRRYDRRHNRQYSPYNRDRYNRDRGYQDRGRRDNYNRGYQGSGSRDDNRRGYQDSRGIDNCNRDHQDTGRRENYSRGYSDYEEDRGQGNRYGQRPN